MDGGAGVPWRAIESCAELCQIFDALFLATENTRLLPGGEEPVYLPADASCAHDRIVFRHDYVASALHEIAHWCIAGAARQLRLGALALQPSPVMPGVNRCRAS